MHFMAPFLASSTRHDVVYVKERGNTGSFAPRNYHCEIRWKSFGFKNMKQKPDGSDETLFGNMDQT